VNKSLRTAIFGLSFCAAAGAVAQSGSTVRILAVPEGMQMVSLHKAVKPFLLPYGGRVDSSRKLYARVFRQSLKELTVDIPQHTPKGQCVVYGDNVRLPAYADNSGMLRMDDLVDYFALDEGQEVQQMTLVFEEDDDPRANGALYLDKSAVDKYFANAMQVPVSAPTEMSRQWALNATARQEQQAALTHRGKSRHWSSLLAAFTVSAATLEPAPAAKPVVATAPVPALILRDCQKVRVIQFQPLQDATQNRQPGREQAFEPYAERTSSGCAQ